MPGLLLLRDRQLGTDALGRTLGLAGSEALSVLKSIILAAQALSKPRLVSFPAWRRMRENSSGRPVPAYPKEVEVSS